MRASLLALAALTLSSCASADATQDQAQATRDCFFASTVSGYSVIDNNTVEVRAGSRRYWLTTMFNARDLDWTQDIAIRSTTGSICTGSGNGVEIIGGEPQRTYPVRSVDPAPVPIPAQN